MTELRHVIRMLRRSPGFVLAAALTLALGIGAGVTVFALIDGVLFRPLSNFESDRVVRLAAVKPGDERAARNNLSWADRRDIAGSSRTLAHLALSGLTAFKLHVGENGAQLVGETVTGDYFRLLHVTTSHGRVLNTTDDVGGAPPVVVISERLRRRFFPASDPVGATITLNRQPFTIVGVAPAAFAGTFIGAPVDVWIAAESADPFFGREWRTMPAFSMIGRLSPGATRAQLQAELDTVWALLARGIRSRADTRLVVLDGDLLGGRRRSVAVMFASVLGLLVALVLVIVCANVANLLLARGIGLRRQMAIRLALGAGRRRLMAMVMTESLIVAAIGGAGALALASVLVRLLSTFDRLPTLTIELGLRVDSSVTIAAGVIALVAGLLLGAIPAVHTSGPDVQAALREESGTVTGGGRMARLRSTLVVAQVAVSLLLLAAAGLFAKSLVNARQLDLGFNPDGAMAIDLDIVPKDVTPEQAHRIYDELAQRLRARGDVSAVAFSNRAPVDVSTPLVDVRLEAAPLAPGQEAPKATMYRATRDYFDVVSIPILRGRAFRDTDRSDTPRVAIINRTLAQRFWPGGDPIGRSFRTGANDPPVEVVGIARDSRYRTPGEDPQPHVYLPFAQGDGQSATVLVRARGDARTLLPVVQREIDGIASLDGTFPRTLRDHLAIYMLPSEIAAALSAALGGVAMLVAAVGLYGLIAYLVTQRTREIAVRMALGASPADIRALVLGGGVRLLVPGVVLGCGGAVAVGQLASGFVYGVGVVDATSLLGAVGLLAIVVMTASYLPARRAMRIDPAVALRR